MIKPTSLLAPLLLAMFVATATPPLALAQEDVAPLPQGVAPAPLRPTKTRGWPIFYREATPDGQCETHAFFSLYYRSIRSDGDSLFVTPFYWSNRERSISSEWSLLLPAYYRQRDPERWSFWSLPFSRGGHLDNGQRWWWAPGFLPLVAGLDSSAEHLQRGGIPFLFDLYGYGRHGEGSDLALISLLPWSRPGTASLSLYQLSRDAAGAVTRTHLFPIYFYSPGQLTLPFLLSTRSWREDFRRDTFLPLLGHYERTADSYDWSALLGLWGGGKTADRSWLRIEPLFDVARGPDSGHTMVAHLYGISWDEAAQRRAHHVLPPLGRFERFADGHRNYLLPLFWSERRAEQDRSISFLFPLYFSYQLAEDRARVGFPLFWQFTNPARSHFHILPLYSSYQTPEQRIDVALAGLYVHTATREKNASSHWVVWPLAQFKSSDAGGHAHVFPFYWSTREGNDRLDVVVPLYLRAVYANRSHHWLIPLWGRYQRDMDDEGTRLDRRFYGGGAFIDSTTTLADGSLKEQRYDLLGPVAGSSHDVQTGRAHSRLLPLWWRTSAPAGSMTILAPVYFQRTARPVDEGFERRLTLVGGTLWFDWQHGGGGSGMVRDRGILWPLSWHHERNGQEGEQEDSWTQVLGLYSHSHHGNQLRRWRLSPFVYHARTSDEQETGLARWLHLYSHESGAWGSRTTLFPALYQQERRGEQLRWDAVLGLVGAERGPERAHWRLLPFYYHDRKGPADDPESEVQVVLPFFHRATQNNGLMRSFSILFPCYYQETSDSSWYRSVLWPLFSARQAPGYARGDFLFLAGYQRDQDDSSWRALPFAESRTLTVSETDGLWSSDGYFGLSLVRRARGPNSHTFALNPLLYGSYHDTTRDRSGWQVLVFLAAQHRHGDRSRFHALGLLNGARNKTGAWWSLFPFAYSGRQDDGVLPRFTMPEALHLYSQVASPVEDRWSVLGILASGRRSAMANESELRVFRRLAVFRRQGSYTERVIEPFFTFEDDPQAGTFYHSILKFFYIAKREQPDGPVKRRLLGVIPL